MNTATVTIGSKEWAAQVALSFSEITTGLSGISSILPNTGMLFDLRMNLSSIPINMSGMLFPLDIVFISEEGSIVGVLQNVQPGESAVYSGAGARLFLEVNAGEADGVAVGDPVTISGYSPGYNWTNIAQTAMVMLFGVVMLAVVLKGIRK